MNNFESHARDFGLNADRHAVPLKTFIGATVAIVLAVFALAAALLSANVLPQDPAPLTFTGP
jgi:hypothetical protein